MRTLISDRPRRRWFWLGFGAVVLVALVALVAVLALPAWRLPENAPLARMYRTEADLAVLVKALDTYHAAYGVYPPAGLGGLRLATDYLSRTGHYMPTGPTPDGWGHPYVYVPNGSYGESCSQALRGERGYFAMDSYQVYSLGADGAAGLTDPEKRRDNITSWDRAKSWRPVYKALNAAYMKARRVKP